jgi:hypothetical protein
MKKQALRRVSFAMIAATAFSLPLISLARAEDGDRAGARTTRDHVIGDEDRGVRKDLYDTTRTPQHRIGPKSDRPDHEHRE